MPTEVRITQIVCTKNNVTNPPTWECTGNFIEPGTGLPVAPATWSAEEGTDYQIALEAGLDELEYTLV